MPSYYWVIFHCIHVIYFVYPLWVSGHLGVFYFLAIMSNMILNWFWIEIKIVFQYFNSVWVFSNSFSSYQLNTLLLPKRKEKEMLAKTMIYHHIFLIWPNLSSLLRMPFWNAKFPNKQRKLKLTTWTSFAPNIMKLNVHQYLWKTWSRKQVCVNSMKEMYSI